MSFASAPTLVGDRVTLEPLRLDHADELALAVQDGRLHELWYSRVPAPETMHDDVATRLEEGVVAEAQDIDLCLLLGAGWPFHLGGITPYLDRSGIAEKVNGQRFLPKGIASPA